MELAQICGCLRGTHGCPRCPQIAHAVVCGSLWSTHERTARALTPICRTDTHRHPQRTPTLCGSTHRHPPHTGRPVWVRHRHPRCALADDGRTTGGRRADDGRTTPPRGPGAQGRRIRSVRKQFLFFIKRGIVPPCFLLVYHKGMEHLKTHLRYDPDTGLFTWLQPTSNRVKVGAQAGKLRKDGYVSIGLNGQQILAHRLAWLYTHGNWPAKEIDHINRNRQDNRIDNLRDVTRSENALNIGPHADGSSGFRGVSWDKIRKGWRVQLRINGKQTYVGVFKNIDEAISAYEKVK